MKIYDASSETTPQDVISKNLHVNFGGSSEVGQNVSAIYCHEYFKDEIE